MYKKIRKQMCVVCSREVSAQACLLVCWCVWHVSRIRWNLVFIGEEWSCGSLFVRIVIVFADNSRLIDKSR